MCVCIQWMAVCVRERVAGEKKDAMTPLQPEPEAEAKPEEKTEEPKPEKKDAVTPL